MPRKTKKISTVKPAVTEPSSLPPQTSSWHGVCSGWCDFWREFLPCLGFALCVVVPVALLINGFIWYFSPPKPPEYGTCYKNRDDGITYAYVTGINEGEVTYSWVTPNWTSKPEFANDYHRSFESFFSKYQKVDDCNAYDRWAELVTIAVRDEEIKDLKNKLEKKSKIPYCLGPKE